MTDGDLADLTWPEVRGGLLLVPLGSLEQHGPHLPLDTDTVIARAVAEAVAGQLGEAPGEVVDESPSAVRVAPAIAYGASGEHEGFPGTVSIGTRALETLITEYARSASGWSSRIAIVNGHGGNVEALRAAVPPLRDREGRDIAWLPCAPGPGADPNLPAPDAHAGRTETSLMMHLQPDRVRTGRIERGNAVGLAELMPAMREGGVAAVAENGVLGDPTVAAAEEGERIFNTVVTGALARISAWRVRAGGSLA